MILCADDYGLNHAVSEGILDLIQAGRINSVSCLSTANCWKEKATALLLSSEKVELGLHLTLTDPKPIHFPKSTLKSLIFKSYMRLMEKEKIAQEIYSQIDLFKNHIGRLPDYVDGHEFCHHLPVVREALVDVAKELQFEKLGIYIRVFNPGRLSISDNIIFWFFNYLASLPSKKLSRLLKKRNVLFNSRLLGFHPYTWEPKKYFEYYFKQKPSDRDIFFCHPGRPSNDLSDSLSGYRPQVYSFMMSSQFDNMRNHYNINLSAFKNQRKCLPITKRQSKK